jgi:hypothetical protein
VRLFLSYRSTDRPAALALEARLAAEGHDVFLDCLPEAGIPIGADWERQIYDAIYDADAMIALVSVAYAASQWCFAELAIARARGLTILPLALGPEARHPLLASVQHVDAVDPSAAADRLTMRLRELVARGNARRADLSPYIGLEPFDVGDGPVFFGRDQEIASVVDLVESSMSRAKRHPIFVTGSSGSGKSSLVRAGLIPALQRRGGWLALPPLIPGESPLDALAVAIASHPGAAAAAPDIDAIGDKLRVDPGIIWQRLQAAGPGASYGLLIVVDQFEELFRSVSAARAREFLAVLDHALQLRAPRVSVVATLRSDAIDQLHAVWAQRAQLVAVYVLPPLSRAALAEVIAGPARVAGIRVSDALVAKLVDDTGDGTALPFLSFMLRQLSAGVARGGEMTLARHNELGGVKKALGQQADQALAEAESESGLTGEQVVQTLIELVTVSDGGSIVRRRRRLQGVDDRFYHVLTPFIDRRLLTVRRERDETYVDVAHESFFTAWDPLVRAIDTQLDRLKLRRQVERDALTWDEAGRPASHLWSPARASALTPLAVDLAALDRAFLQAALDLGSEQKRADADSAATQLLLAELPRYDPDTALALGLALVDEYAGTPRCVRCLYDALVWHRIDQRGRELEILGMRGVSLDLAPDVVAVSVDVADPPHEKPSTMKRSFGPAKAIPATLVVRRWNIDAHEPRWVAEVEGSSIVSVVGCRNIVAVATDRVVAFLDADSGRTVRIDESSYRVMALEPMARQMAVQTVDGFSVRQIDTNALVREFRTDQSLTAVRFSQPGGRVACQTAGGWGPEWDIATGTSTAEAGGRAIEWPAPILIDGSLSNTERQAKTVIDDTRLLAAVWTSKRVTVYRLRQPASIALAQQLPPNPPEPDVSFAQPPDVRAIGELPWHDLAPRQIAGTPDGRTRVIELNDLWVVECDSGRLTPLHRGGVQAAAFSANGRWLALAYRTALTVFDVSSASVARTFGDHDDEEGDIYCAVAISDDGRRVVSGSLAGGRSWLWDVASGERLNAVGGISVAIDEAGVHVLAADHRSVRAIRVGEAVVEMRLLEGVAPVCAIPLLRGLGSDGAAPQITPTSPWMVGRGSLSISPDGRLAAVAGGWWTAVFDLPSGEPLMAWEAEATAVTFGADSRTMLVRSKTARVLLSIPSFEEIVAQARRKATRRAEAGERAKFGF